MLVEAFKSFNTIRLKTKIINYYLLINHSILRKEEPMPRVPVVMLLFISFFIVKLVVYFCQISFSNWFIRVLIVVMSGYFLSLFFIYISYLSFRFFLNRKNLKANKFFNKILVHSSPEIIKKLVPYLEFRIDRDSTDYFVCWPGTYEPEPTTGVKTQSRNLITKLQKRKYSSTRSRRAWECWPFFCNEDGSSFLDQWNNKSGPFEEGASDGASPSSQVSEVEEASKRVIQAEAEARAARSDYLRTIFRETSLPPAEREQIIQKGARSADSFEFVNDHFNNFASVGMEAFPPAESEPLIGKTSINWGLGSTEINTKEVLGIAGKHAEAAAPAAAGAVVAGAVLGTAASIAPAHANISTNPERGPVLDHLGYPDAQDSPEKKTGSK